MKNDGGQAYPYVGYTKNGEIKSPGMSLRDYFAGQAMQSQLESLIILAKESMIVSAISDKKEIIEEFFDNMIKNIPEQSYRMADEMIKEKNSEKTESL